jgi:branched-chain amino acid transport system substrate-binding protein
MRVSRRLFLKALGVGAGALTLSQVLGWGQQPPVKIGLIGPIDLLNVGKTMMRGAQLALEEINKLVDEKKLPPPKLTMDGLIRDDQRHPDVARAAFEELVEKGAQVIIGGFLDEAVMRMIPSMARLRKPFLNTGTSGKQFSELVKSDYEKYKYYFRLMFNTEVLGQDAVGMAKGFMKEKLGIQKVALVMEDSNFGQDFLKILQAKLPSEADVEVAKAFLLPKLYTSFTFNLQDLKDSEADAVIVTFFYNSGRDFVSLVYDQKLDMPIFGFNAEGQAFEYWKDTGARVMGNVYIDVALGETPITPKTRPFYQAYVERFRDSAPSRPFLTAFTTYDALFILKEAIDRAKGTDPDKLVEELEKTDYGGTVGRWQFQGKDGSYPHDPKYGPEHVVAKWVLWGATGEYPFLSTAQVVRGIVWPPQFRLKEYPEGNPVSIDDCINKACEEYRKSVAAWKQQGKPSGGRFNAWQSFARKVAQCYL